ncbi:deoxyguanosinetriphosphate triphosphohydrolase [Lysinibacter sp. HNR]|uniref:deoxyguanosinetriphosphate triphosphohydrolase n=1 Tax=Lysinibacter sp. HNR TaxID=3031408 RepID=UPI002435C2DB|nr:deoxyguanosinetriphosphate triphosphohydrolase [Lysinibacter sp. HNR]WGD36559.1 deoxyguanosinetriphosphate triphosphohydrolase [Lysinibacter sp. HNR]
MASNPSHVQTFAQSDSRYSAHDEERWLPEEHPYTDRSDFARDRARLLHSSALRRLAAKTQVLSPTAGIDFARNRLTHSLEVAQVGRELATSLGLNPDVVDTACLAHDLGHPPFGHNGERALNEWMKDSGGFEGNAQTLRILSRLEPKVFSQSGTGYGLNLTRASVDASCKYPWPRGLAVDDPSGRQKFGVYEDDLPVFSWLREGAPEGRVCVEAQVMDLSDDIAYSVHDFEDAIVGEYIDPAILSSRVGHDSLIRTVAEWSGNEVGEEDLADAFDRLAASSLWLTSWSGSRRDHAQLKNFTSQMIGRFAHLSTDATRAAFPQQSLVRFGADIVVPAEVRAEIAVLKGVVAAFVMSSGQRQPIYKKQRTLLTELMEALYDREGAELDPAFVVDWEAAEGDAARRRVIVDQVATLTDQSAIAWHERLCAVPLV